MKQSLFVSTHSLLTFPSTVCIPSHCWKRSARLETPRLRLGSSSVDSLADFDILLFWGRAGTCVAVLSCISNGNCMFGFFYSLIAWRHKNHHKTQRQEISWKFNDFHPDFHFSFILFWSLSAKRLQLLFCTSSSSSSSPWNTHTCIHRPTLCCLTAACLPACVRRAPPAFSADHLLFPSEAH